MGISLLLFWLMFFWGTPFSHADAIDISSEWGGYLRGIGTHASPDDESIYKFTDTGPFVDGQAEIRINNQLFLGTKWSVETHYEMVGRQGDTLKNNNRLRGILPAMTVDQLAGQDSINDDLRLMNLTGILDDGEDYSVYHRLDRLNLTYSSDLATLRMGRQALTWGNGLFFNPMDIFNPFSPTSIQRDYKVGEDMAHLQITRGDTDGQVLYVPRRNPISNQVSANQSSFAGKWHFPGEGLEFDLMAARHFNDIILGGGASGNWGGATWRGDIIYTHLDDDTSQSDYCQVVINLDYAWQWGGKNVYGLVEYYHNGLGETQDYGRTLADPAISQRLTRGELFTLGRNYLAGRLQFEFHPLLLAGVTTVVNLADPSAIIQPQLNWDMATNVQLILGANINWGDDGTEFGGFDVASDTATIKVAPADSRYLWLSYYF